MRFLIVILFAFTGFSAVADILEFSANGTISSVSGFDSLAGVGDTFTWNALVDSTEPGSPAGDSTVYPVTSLIVTVGDLTYTDPGFVTIVSGDAYLGYGYAFYFQDPDPSAIQRGLRLLSSNPIVAPTTALVSLQSFPLDTFDSQGTGLEFQDGGRTNYNIVGTITSYSVTVTTVPEPSTLALLVGGVGLLAARWMRTRPVV
jgi:PEP-CTERM motif